MSRSYRKPWFVDGYGKESKQKVKRQANKYIRQLKDKISNGGYFKKLFNSWDICDWKFYDPDSDKARRK